MTSQKRIYFFSQQQFFNFIIETYEQAQLNYFKSIQHIKCAQIIHNKLHKHLNSRRCDGENIAQVNIFKVVPFAIQASIVVFYDRDILCTLLNCLICSADARFLLVLLKISSVSGEEFVERFALAFVYKLNSFIQIIFYWFGLFIDNKSLN